MERATGGGALLDHWSDLIPFDLEHFKNKMSKSE
jgi:hypothetical protein